MPWLVLGVILLVVAVAGGAIVHPILFVLGLARRDRSTSAMSKDRSEVTLSPLIRY